MRPILTIELTGLRQHDLQIDLTDALRQLMENAYKAGYEDAMRSKEDDSEEK